MRKQSKRRERPQLSVEQISDALLASGGILSTAALHLSEQLGRCVGRDELAKRIDASPHLAQIRQIAEDRRVEQAIEEKGQRRKKRPLRDDPIFDPVVQDVQNVQRAARAAERETAQELKAVGLSYSPPSARSAGLDDSDAHDQRPRPWSLQAERDKRLCLAMTRQGYPCVRRVVPGKNRCPSHGGKSTGPRTPEGREAIRRANRKRAAERRGG